MTSRKPRSSAPAKYTHAALATHGSRRHKRILNHQSISQFRPGDCVRIGEETFLAQFYAQLLPYVCHLKPIDQIQYFGQSLKGKAKYFYLRFYSAKLFLNSFAEFAYHIGAHLLVPRISLPLFLKITNSCTCTICTHVIDHYGHDMHKRQRQNVPNKQF